MRSPAYGLAWESLSRISCVIGYYRDFAKQSHVAAGTVPFFISCVKRRAREQRESLRRCLCCCHPWVDPPEGCRCFLQWSALVSVVGRWNSEAIRNSWPWSEQCNLRGFAVSCYPNQSGAVMLNGSSSLWTWPSFQGLKKKKRKEEICVGEEWRMEMRGAVYLGCELRQWGQNVDMPLRVAVKQNLTNK